MARINLDPRTLLGFKITGSDSEAKLRSPKIGAKGCVVTDLTTADALPPASIRAPKV
jgi:hypothetical protein